MVHGMIIKESLTDPALLADTVWEIVDRYPMRMDGKIPIEIVMVNVARESLLDALQKVCKRLFPTRFYAHFVDGATMYVVYPGTVSIVERADPASSRTCIQLGQVFGIPEAQLPIEKMFQFGHAEHPEHKKQ